MLLLWRVSSQPHGSQGTMTAGVRGVLVEALHGTQKCKGSGGRWPASESQLRPSGTLAGHSVPLGLSPSP